MKILPTISDIGTIKRLNTFIMSLKKNFHTNSQLIFINTHKNITENK